MNFRIQVNCPRISGILNEDDESLDEAIETVFLLNTETMIMIWNDVYIPLTYKYDLSVIMKDIMIMLEKLCNSSSGKLTIHWPSNTFSSIWNFQWEDNKLKIDTRWFTVIGDTEGLLNSRNVIEIDKTSFIQEWKTLLLKIRWALEESGYNSAKIPEMERLAHHCNIIPGGGILYQAR